jgi:type IV secretion system protein TrbL
VSPIAVHAGSKLRGAKNALGFGVPVGASALVSYLAKRVASELLENWFSSADHWVAKGATWMLGAAWKMLAETTSPAISGPGFDSEIRVMAVIGASVALPLLLLGVIQAVVRQDGGGLLRTLIVRLPMALLFTGLAVQLVSLGLAWTDQASDALLATGSNATQHLFFVLQVDMVGIGATGIGEFAGALVLVVSCLVAFTLWVELAVRSAGVAAATLFLPLSLAGLVWPVTAHWARRLGETLAGLILMKLVMAAVLALAAGAIAGDDAGISGAVEGLALLLIAAFAPFAVMRLLPMIETGAATSLEGVSRRAITRPVGGAAWSIGEAAGALPEKGRSTVTAMKDHLAQRSGSGGPGAGGGEVGSDHLPAAPHAVVSGSAAGAESQQDTFNTRAPGGGGGAASSGPAPGPAHSSAGARTTPAGGGDSGG